MIAEIKGSLLRIEQQEPLIQGTVGQTLGVRLSEEWAGLTVTAVFSAGSVARDVAVTGDGLVIPWELLAEPEHTLFLTAREARLKNAVSQPKKGCVHEDQIHRQAQDRRRGARPSAGAPVEKL